MIELYSIFHKPFYIPAVDYVIPIQAGKAIASLDLEIAGDNTGDNISHLNNFYCELTAMYWIVKNADRASLGWGLCHYRRYFMQRQISLKKKSVYTFHPSQKKIDAIVNEKLYPTIQKLLGTHDAIVQLPKFIHKKKGVIRTLEENYKDHHLPLHWEIVKRVTLDKYPDYKESWVVFKQSVKMSFYNMMIAKWEVWDAYTNWLFDILFAVFPLLDDDPHRDRVMGFMSERLMNLYLVHNKIKTAYLPVASFDKS